MTTPRRDFLKHSSFIAGGLFLTSPIETLASFSKGTATDETNKLSIVHTNDLHNQLDPLEKYSTLGGLKNIRHHLKHLICGSLLLDAGDFLDDSASFDDHCEMIGAMNRMGYSAGTIGNRELANGEAYLASLLPYINFPLVNCNYDFTNPDLKEKILPYVIRQSGKFRIGITGIGPDVHVNGVTCQHPYAAANKLATWLKDEKSCDLVICLSHIGYNTQSATANNTDFARASTSIDVIISGHQQFLSNGLLVCKNTNKEAVIVSHGGEGGIVVKQLIFTFDENKKRRNLSFRNFVPGLPSGISAYTAIRKMNA
jgi:5'-nucleotidase